MPELRKDPVTSRWVIIRSESPQLEFQNEPNLKTSRVCPFCPGNESMTPPEISSVENKTPSKQSRWQVRVVPNKFPALRIEGTTEKTTKGIYDRVGGFGAHEVIIENPDHGSELADLPAERVEDVLKMYRDRCLDLRRDPRFRYILIFKNYGASAGASLEHPHSQLIGLPIVPSRVLHELKGAQHHFDQTKRCLFCDLLNQEKSEKKLTVFSEGDFIALAPFAARFPFETWVLPKTHAASFDSLTDAQIKDLAKTLKTTLLKLKKALKDPSYNFMVHTLPIQGEHSESFHWHIEIIPQLTQVAGFEMGTGFYLNPAPPEAAASKLRDI